MHPVEGKVKGGTMEVPTESAFPRIKALDGLRGIAVLLVITSHFFPYPIHPNGAFERLYAGVVNFGYSGVDLFFVLSGFFITRILISTRGRQSYFSSFYVRRILRIWPLYFSLCIVAIVVIPAIPQFASHHFFSTETGSSAYYWLFLNNFWDVLPVRGYVFLAVTWSLAMEEQFYLVWPLIIWLLTPQRIFHVAVGMIVGTAILRNVLYYGFGVSGETLYYDTFTHLDGLALGILTAIVWEAPLKYKFVLRFLSWQLAVTIPALTWVVIYSALFPTIGLEKPDDMAYQPLMLTVGYTLTAFVYGGILVIFLTSERSRILAYPALRSVGKYSYAMYLLHFPVWYVGSMLLHDVFLIEPGPDIERTPLKFAVGIVGTYLVAVLSWKLLEGPINALKARFPYSVDPTPTTSCTHGPRFDNVD
jgi:peptidoglycan/LPS O-acetylase OafA/YrhL